MSAIQTLRSPSMGAHNDRRALSYEEQQRLVCREERAVDALREALDAIEMLTHAYGELRLLDDERAMEPVLRRMAEEVRPKPEDTV